VTSQIPLTRQLHLGSYGPDVEGVKIAVLRTLGNVKAWRVFIRSPRIVRRTYGPFFVARVKTVQRRNGIISTGIYGQRTHQVLVRKRVPSGQLVFNSRARSLMRLAVPSYLFPIPIGYNWTFLGGMAVHMSRSMGGWESDRAEDYGASAGTPIIAPFSGYILGTGGRLSVRGTRFGYYVTIVGEQESCFLAHLGQLSVTTGSQIRAGDIVGTVGGASGWTSHLHIGLKYGDPAKVRKWPRYRIALT